MAVIDRFKSLFTSTTPLQSSGSVARNYGKRPVFDPVRQVTGVTYKAIDKIGQSLSVYEPIVKKPNGDAYVNHPVLSLFNNPNPRMNASDFVHLFGMLYEIYGETFWYLAKGENTNRVKEIYLLNPAQVELQVHEGEIIGYVLHKANGDQVPFLPDEIIHDKRPNPFNEWRGLSVIEKAASYIDIEIDATNFTLNYIRNNASPSGIVSLPTMSQENFKKFTLQWREGYEGPQNAGKTAFIRGGEANFKAVGATLKDVEIDKLRNMSKDDVLMMLDVPKPLLGMTDEKGFGRGNIETLNYIFADNKLEPMMRRLDRIYEKIGTDMMKGQVIDIQHESPVPEDKEYMLNYYEKGVNVWLTINEVRAGQGLDPLPNGDILVEAPAPAAKTIKVVKKKTLTKSEQLKKINQEQEDFRSKLVETNDLFANRVQGEISSFTAEQEKKVISNINASAKSYEEWLFNIKEDSERLSELLLPIFVELAEAQIEDVAHFITGELITVTSELRTIMETDIKQISGVFNSDTLTQLQKTLAAGQADGESLVSLKKRVEKVYTDAKGYRAERIARTESLRMSNATAEQVYKANGYTQVQWFINPGACEFCKTFAGRTKTIGTNYVSLGDVISAGDKQMKNDYRDISTPPLHPNCTCSLIPVK